MVQNDRGSFEVLAEVSESVMRVFFRLMSDTGLNRTGTAVNSTTPDGHCNLGQAGLYI